MPDVKIRVEAVSSDELQTQKQGQEVINKENSQNIMVASLFAHQALNTTKQIVNYGISNIGNFTGDYAKQDRVQEIVSGIGDLATIGLAMATGNPFAVFTATVGLTTKKILEVVSENQTVKHAERNAEYLRKRSGNSTQNGSR